jgi:hydroxymethylpyrimidine kinase / phosphomethylpyrimidine kinase / thiamine-phosphate diphosphorylase
MTARRHARLADARLYVVGPARIGSGRLAAAVPPLASAGVDVVQLRDRTLSEAGLLAEARACAEAAARAGILFIVNDSPELARAAGADGVHLGQDDGAIADARAILGPERIIGRSTRGGDMLDAAADESADYASVGPVWETPTKAGRPPIGLSPIPDAARRARIPWFAIGGIDARRAPRVGALGAIRIAAVRSVCDAPDPAAAARALRGLLVDAAPRVLTVAGTDSGGGAGIQADTKAIARAGGFPLCAVTAVTAQSTIGVDASTPIDVDLVAGQIRAVDSDIGIDGAKTGMLATPALVEAVARSLSEVRSDEEIPLVVDTVLRAESGAPLMEAGGEEAYRTHLLPRATVITPNLAEARALAKIDSDDAELLAQTLHERHGCAVIVTGGHGARSADTLCDAEGLVAIPGPRLPRATTHGAGCTHSATLAALMARGIPLREAAWGAKQAATLAVAGGRSFGSGAGPVDVLRIAGTA